MAGNGGRRKRRKSRFGLWMAVAFIVLIAGYLAVLEYSKPHVDGDALRYDTFVSHVVDGRIESAHILDEDAYIVGEYETDDGTTGEYNAPLIRGTQGDLASMLVERQIPTTVDQQVVKRLLILASYTIPGLILILLFVYLIVSYRRGTGLFGITSGARKIEAEDADVTFDDVAGQDEAVAELKDVKAYLTDPGRFADMGAQVPRGVLLYGPPGCGKTLLARALAGEAGASFFSISGSDFVEMYVGVGASRVRDLFDQAYENAPAIVFIDELDSIGKARGKVGTAQSHGEQEQALNQILAEMDGFTPTEGVIVVAATNRPDILDQALLRPGRFDRTVGLERPGEADRLAILRVHARNKKLADDVDLGSVAVRAVGLTGADLAGVLNDAALLAARRNLSAIGQGEVDEALQRMLEAPERQRRLSLKEKSIGKRHAGADRVTFDDVAGVDDAVAELEEVTAYLADPGRFTARGAKVPRGILLSGPPGVGKTLLARAVAGEANAAFLSVAGSEFVEIFVGEGASRVRELFSEAKSMAPAIVFIDELDAVGGHRAASAAGGGRERENTLNQILVELDGFEDRAAVIVMAATNRADMLDSALVRPGRFDRQITVAPPDRAGRRAILELHAADKPLAEEVDLDRLAALTQGFTGADLANMLNEAALLAARRDLDAIDMELIDEAIDRARMGVTSRGTIMSDDERRVVAYHESGHALAAVKLEGARPPHKLTIVARGPALGHFATVDTHDRVMRSRSELLDDMAVALAGRIAEEIVLGETTTGAGSDLRAVEETARRMVCEWGMGKQVAGRSFPDIDERRRQPLRYSEAAAATIDNEITQLIGEAEQRARDVLSDRAVLDRIAQALLEHETLTATELQELAATPLDAKRSRKTGKKQTGVAESS